WPTFRTLQRLAGCSSVEDVLALRVQPEPPPMPGHGRSPEWRGQGEEDGRPEAGPGAEASAGCAGCGSWPTTRGPSRWRGRTRGAWGNGRRWSSTPAPGATVRSEEDTAELQSLAY